MFQFSVLISCRLSVFASFIVCVLADFLCLLFSFSSPDRLKTPTNFHSRIPSSYCCFDFLSFLFTPTRQMDGEKAEKDDKRKSSKPKPLNLGPPPPKKPRKAKDFAALCASTATATALLSLAPSDGHSSAGSASTGTVALPSQQQQQQHSQRGSVSVFSWPSTGNLAFDEIIETEV